MGWFVTLTVIEIVLLVAVLAFFLILLTRRLRDVVENLARISFGVRAVETQVGNVGPTVSEMNDRLAEITPMVSAAADRAERSAR